jgi:hypothetical protein
MDWLPRAPACAEPLRNEFDAPAWPRNEFDAPAWLNLCQPPDAAADREVVAAREACDAAPYLLLSWLFP